MTISLVPSHQSMDEGNVQRSHRDHACALQQMPENDTFRSQFGHLNVASFCTEFPHLTTPPHSRVYVLKWKTLNCQRTSILQFSPYPEACHFGFVVFFVVVELMCQCIFRQVSLFHFPRSFLVGAQVQRSTNLHRAKREPARPEDTNPVIPFSGHRHWTFLKASPSEKLS